MGLITEQSHLGEPSGHKRDPGLLSEDVGFKSLKATELEKHPALLRERLVGQMLAVCMCTYILYMDGLTSLATETLTVQSDYYLQ